MLYGTKINKKLDPNGNPIIEYMTFDTVKKEFVKFKCSSYQNDINNLRMFAQKRGIAPDKVFTTDYEVLTKMNF